MLKYRKINIKIIIKDESKKRKFFNTLVNSLKPDDIGIDETTNIIYKTHEKYLEIVIDTNAKIESVQATLNDIIRCLRTAINSLDFIEKP